MSDIPPDIAQDLRAGLKAMQEDVHYPPTRYPVSSGQYMRFLAWKKRTGKVSFWDFIIEEKELPCQK